MTFLSGREDLNEASGELRASGRAGAVREAVPRAAAGGSPVTEQMPATWADAAERLAEMRAMQELNENECVIEEPCMPDGGIVLLRHGESEWNAANRYRANCLPLPPLSSAAPSPSAANPSSPVMSTPPVRTSRAH